MKNTEKAKFKNLTIHLSTMADFPPFKQTYLAGNTIITVNEEFVTKYKKVWLRSDESDRNWRVRLEDYFLTDGWEEFAAAHNLKDGDVLVLRHEREDVFHVSVESRSVSSDVQNALCTDVDIGEDCAVDNGVDVGDGEYEGDAGNISEKKDQYPEADSSCFVVRVSRYSLLSDRLDLGRKFASLFSGGNKMREIDVKNEEGRRWTMVLVLNKSTGLFYIRRGWENFCCANGLIEGDFYMFKLVENGENPVLLLLSEESAINKSSSREEGEEKEQEEQEQEQEEQEQEEEDEKEECREADAAVQICSAGGCREEKSISGEGLKGKEKKTPSRFVTLEYTRSRHRSGQLSFPRSFTREIGIKKSVELTLLNKDGRKWSAYLQMTGCAKNGSEWFYLRGGWREMCKANGVMVDDSFMLELIWDDANAAPMLKFCSKIQKPESQCKGRSSLKKRGPKTVRQPKVEARGSKRITRGTEQQESEKLAAMEPSYHTPTAKKSSSNKRKLQYTQPRSSSLSDQVSNVRQSIVDTLTTVKRFQVELGTREHKLEAALLEIDGLGKKISGITKILYNNLD